MWSVMPKYESVVSAGVTGLGTCTTQGICGPVVVRMPHHEVISAEKMVYQGFLEARKRKANTLWRRIVIMPRLDPGLSDFGRNE
ncbi:uncharacterized protein BT62DRAFT_722538 [Guyanagaster necrorhizus]|uniref:Uncharacterized protein n=1 Tax=Guyanagaster necrorhizus TaxID=856835 RepID=A0A9P8AV32_9AGAR|nr:uncharacterized protein BT62DRAFT_722538 [Guyanagaster necrorhizus MCA 3950]KAG7448701.1 hypothetical protein BT62DRAFT_722538 [Guyanagaster necrorhizus MCA 3950]